MSARIRLTLWYAAITAATLISFSVLLYIVLGTIQTNDTDQFLQSKASDIAASSRITQRSGYQAVNIQPLDLFAESDVYVQLLTTDGRVLNESQNLSEAGVPLDQADLRAAAGGRTTFSTVEIRGLPIRVVTRPLLASGGTPFVLEVGRSFDSVERTRARLRQLLILGDLLVVAVAALVGWWLAARSFQPIVRITRIARAIGQSQTLDQRVEYTGPTDELGELAATFNGMLDRLENSFAAQRRFVADASHELRTPLTTLRLNVEVLRRDQAAEPPERREVLDDIASELDRLSRLVQGLLDLARADAGYHLEKQPVDADELVSSVYHQVLPVADGVALEIGALLPIRVSGNPDYLKQLIITLVDNALKHTPPGGRVRLSIERDDVWAKIIVSDTGIGIDPTDAPHIFERFYRAPAVRAKRGTGLGLAVAQWIAEEHGGHISVDSTPGEGSTFTLWLPEFVRGR